MQYVAETWATMKQQEKRIEVNKMSADATVDARSDTQQQDQERTHPREECLGKEEMTTENEMERHYKHVRI